MNTIIGVISIAAVVFLYFILSSRTDDKNRSQIHRRRPSNAYTDTEPMSQMTMDVLDSDTMRIRETIPLGEIGKKGIVIGRYPTCDVVLSDGSVSRQHCLLRMDKGQFLLEDLGSLVGIFDGKDPEERKKRIWIEPGEVCYLAEVPVKFNFRNAYKRRFCVGEDGFQNIDVNDPLADIEDEIQDRDTRKYDIKHRKR